MVSQNLLVKKFKEPQRNLILLLSRKRRRKKKKTKSAAVPAIVHTLKARAAVVEVGLVQAVQAAAVMPKILSEKGRKRLCHS